MRITPKALSNFSPGLPQPWGEQLAKISKTPEVLAKRASLANSYRVILFDPKAEPRVEATARLELENTFGVGCGGLTITPT